MLQDIEMLFAFIAMVFGVMIFATVSGTLTTIVMSSKAAEQVWRYFLVLWTFACGISHALIATGRSNRESFQVYNEKMDGIRQYLSAKKIPKEVRAFPAAATWATSPTLISHRHWCP